MPYRRPTPRSETTSLHPLRLVGHASARSDKQGPTLNGRRDHTCATGADQRLSRPSRWARCARRRALSALARLRPAKEIRSQPCKCCIPPLPRPAAGGEIRRRRV
jgi:hypothetical protein